jgi:hypothetical protein
MQRLICKLRAVAALTVSWVEYVLLAATESRRRTGLHEFAALSTRREQKFAEVALVVVMTDTHALALSRLIGLMDEREAF